jgi:cation:H+ antiporter
MWLNILLFAGSVAVVLWACQPLANGLDRLGSKLHLSDGALGILVALGADSPEISSAVVALLSKQRDLGVGIVLGSNLFNLAALLGLGAVVAGEVSAGSAGTILDGAVAIAITLIAGALLGGIAGPLTSTILLLLIFVPYVYFLAAGSKVIARVPLPPLWKQYLIHACDDSKRAIGRTGKVNDLRVRQRSEPEGEVIVTSWKPVLWVLPAICLVVAGSIGLIRSATALGQGWLPQPVLGTFVLAALTGLPNSVTAVRLARHGRGAAVITETFNSNTINIMVGLMLPTLIIGQGTLNPLTLLDIFALLLLTAIAAILTAQGGKLTRKRGIVLIALYLVFVGMWTAIFKGALPAGG